MGYTKVSLEDSFPEDVPTEKEVERSRQRAKHFLTVHVMSSVVILGSSIIFLLIYVFTNEAEMQQRVAFNLDLLVYLFLPILGLALAFLVLLVRPYHRCDCSGGERPSGNVIV